MAVCLRTSRGMWCLRHAGALALAWRRGPVCACARVCWCRRIFTYIMHTHYSRDAIHRPRLSSPIASSASSILMNTAHHMHLASRQMQIAKRYSYSQSFSRSHTDNTTSTSFYSRDLSPRPRLSSPIAGLAHEPTANHEPTSSSGALES